MNKAAKPPAHTREADREARWLARYKTAWTLTPPDGTSLREYALDEDHAMAIVLYRAASRG
jgi:hypothetical protein